MKRFVALAIALFFAAPAVAQTPFTYPYNTPNGIQYIVAGQIGAGLILPFAVPTDITGTPLGSLANPQAMKFGTGVLLPGFASPPLIGNATFGATGSTGTDASANKPTLPNVGANFVGSGPYASYILISTLAASPTRNNVDVENTSGAQIAVVRDDGTASGGSQPVNASVFSLGGGASAGAQGGAWSSETFKGRLQIYAPSSGASVTVMVD